MESSKELQQEFLDDIVKISPLIEDYMAAKLFELEVEYQDDVGQLTIFNLVLGMILGELTTMGIEIFGGSDIYNDPEKITLIKYLRSIFDLEAMRELLIRSEDFRNDIESASADWDEENVVHSVAQFATATFPLSTEWEYIEKRSLEHVASTHNLERHLLRIIEAVENGTFSDNEEDELINQYTQEVSAQRSRFIQHIQTLRKDLQDIEGVVNHSANMIIDESLLTYDVDLINNMHPDHILLYLNPDDPHPAYRSDKQDDIQLVNHHKRLHTHHVECLLVKELLTNEVTHDAPYVVLLVADGYRDPWSVEDNIKVFEEYTKPLNLSVAMLEHARRWIKLIAKQ